MTAIRQSSLFFHPKFIRGRDGQEAAEALLPYRRDAVASILSTLYILAGALRSNMKIPVRVPLELITYL